MHEVITGGNMAEYGLKYVANFDSRKEAGAKAFTLEIWQKDLPQSFEAKTIRAWRGLTLEVDGDDDPVSPIQKTIVNFTLVDAPEIADAATEKSGDWQEFFTPDSTMYKVIIKQGQQYLWSGFITPDNWQESLDYRGAVTITARDNIGHLQDFDFDLQGDKAGTATIANLLKAAIDKIDFRMAIYYLIGDWEYQSDHKWILYDNSELADFRVNVSQFEGKNWYEVLEAVLSSLGLFLRYTGKNQYVVSHLRYLPWLGNPTRQDTDVQDVIFLGGGTRTYKPAYKRIVENVKYDFSEEAQYDAADGLSLSTSTDTYTTDISVMMQERPATYSQITGAITQNTNTAAKGWQAGRGFGPLHGRTSSELDLDHVALLAANEQTASRVYIYDIDTLLAGMNGTLELQFAESPAIYAQRRGRQPEYVLLSNSTTGGSGGSTQRKEFTPHLSSLKYALAYTTLDGTTYYKTETSWQTSSKILEYNEDQTAGSISFNLEDSSTLIGQTLMRTAGRLRLVLSDIYFNVGDANKILTPQGCGIYMAVTGISLVAKTNGKLESDKTTTINNDDYNVTETRTPDIGFLSRDVVWQTPQNYGNAVYYENSEGLVAPVLQRVTWAGVTSPFPVFLHKQILQYHREPMQLLEGDCMPSPAGLWNYNSIVRYKGHKFLLQGGTYDFVSGIMSGVRLHEFEQYDDIWSEDTPDVGGVWSVTLVSAGENKVAVIRALVNSAGISLTDAKTMADNSPALVGDNYTNSEAQSIQEAIAAAGGTATIAEVTIN